MAEAHLAQSLQFAIRFSSQALAYEQQGALSDFARNRAQHIIDEVFDEVSDDAGLLRVDCLQVDLGTVGARDMEQQWENRLREQLREALYRYRQRCRDVGPQELVRDHGDEPAQLLPLQQAEYETLLHFLRRGYLPWHARRQGSDDVSVLAERVIRQCSAQLIASLGSAPILLSRLVQQVSEGTLEKLAAQLWPRSLGAPARLVQDLASGCSAAKLGDGDTASLRRGIWQLLLSELLRAGERGMTEAQLSAATGKALARHIALTSQTAEPEQLQLQQWRATVTAALTGDDFSACRNGWPVLLTRDADWLRAALEAAGRRAHTRRLLAQQLDDYMLCELSSLWLSPADAEFLAALMRHPVMLEVTTGLQLREYVWGCLLLYPSGENGRHALVEGLLLQIARERGRDGDFVARFMLLKLQGSGAAVQVDRDLARVLTDIIESGRFHAGIVVESESAAAHGDAASKELMAQVSSPFERSPRSFGGTDTALRAAQSEEASKTSDPDKLQRWRAAFAAALASDDFNACRNGWPVLLAEDADWLRAALETAGRRAHTRRLLARQLDDRLLCELSVLWLLPADVELLATLVRHPGMLEMATEQQLREYAWGCLLLYSSGEDRRRAVVESLLLQTARARGCDSGFVARSMLSKLAGDTLATQVDRDLAVMLRDIVESSQPGASIAVGHASAHENGPDANPSPPGAVTPAVLRMRFIVAIKASLAGVVEPDLIELWKALLEDDAAWLRGTLEERRADTAGLLGYVAQYAPESLLIESLAPWCSTDERVFVAALMQWAAALPGPSRLHARPGLRGAWEWLIGYLCSGHGSPLSRGHLLDALLQQTMENDDAGTDEPPAPTWPTSKPAVVANGASAAAGLLLPELARDGDLRAALESPQAAAQLIDVLDEAQRQNVLRFLEPVEYVRISDATRLIAEACGAMAGAGKSETLQRLRWQFIFRECHERGRRYQLAEFARRFAEYLRGALSPPDPVEWRNNLIAALPGAAAGTGAAARTGLAAEIVAALSAPPATNGASKPQSSWLLSFEQPAIGESIYIGNAGMVLAAPYIPRLFSMLELIREDAFVSTAAAQRAVHLLQFMVSGAAATPEHRLVLNKLICGLPLQTPIALDIDIRPDEAKAIEDMLAAMIRHWSIIGQTSLAGLRESFLLREGRLTCNEEHWQLLVEPRAFDMLLDQLPWGYATLKYPWMERVIHVDWR